MFLIIGTACVAIVRAFWNKLLKTGDALLKKLEPRWEKFIYTYKGYFFNIHHHF